MIDKFRRRDKIAIFNKFFYSHNRFRETWILDESVKLETIHETKVSEISKINIFNINFYTVAIGNSYSVYSLIDYNSDDGDLEQALKLHCDIYEREGLVSNEEEKEYDFRKICIAENNILNFQI